ncbi:MAG: hypothetical protein R3264_07950, partial [Anaerolineae bacterium]|nr:hypothetical protein [Anaerolineae bacterium]
TFEEAITLKRDLGQEGAAFDDLAGLAQVAMAQDQTAEALRHTEEIVAWLDEKGPGGIEYPLQVYLTCYQVLTAAGEPWQRAADLLQKAHTMLMEQAGDITDRELRRSFLENVAANREIRRLWSAARSEG